MSSVISVIFIEQALNDEIHNNFTFANEIIIMSIQKSEEKMETWLWKSMITNESPT